MAVFQYQVQQQGGGVYTGQVTADSLADATSQVRDQGGYLLDISAVSSGPMGLLQRLREVRIDTGPSLKDIQGFTSQLAVMIKSGISVRDAIAGIGEQTSNPKFQGIIEQIRLDVESGKPFSEALARHPNIFGPLYVNMVKASEMSGSFGHMLERISGYLRQQLETRAMVRGAMVYPIIIAVMAVGTTIFLLTFVLPRFSGLFAGKEDLLPAPTKLLLGLSDFLRNYWYVVIGVAGALIGGFLYFVRTPFGRVWWDGAKLKIPVIKKLLSALYLTRGLQTMGEMINAGVPMLDTLEITAEVSGNTKFQRMWMAVHRSVKGGNTIAEPLRQGELLPASVTQMIASGEESGKLGEVLADIAEYYAQELKNIIKTVTAMLEPLMIIVMGLVVGFIAMSIILPIFKMSSLVK
jgi:type IV pilus assembly protein PilC